MKQIYDFRDSARNFILYHRKSQALHLIRYACYARCELLKRHCKSAGTIIHAMA